MSWLVRIVCLLVLVLGSSCRKAEPEGRSSAPGPLIELQTLLAPPAIEAPLLSPDGRWISYVRPVSGAMNFFVAPVADPHNERQVSDRLGRGVQARDVSGNVMYRWTADSRRIVYPSDHEGDENWNLFVIDVETGYERQLTDLEGVRVQLLALSDADAGTVLVSINDRDPAFSDLYEIDLGSAERRLVEKNPGFLAWIADRRLRPRIGMALNVATGGLDLFSSVGDGEWMPMFSVGPEDLPALSTSGSQKIVRFGPDNRTVTFYDSRGRDTNALVRFDLESGSSEVVAQEERVDIGGVLYHPSEHRVQAYAVDWTRREWRVVDDRVREPFAALSAATEGDVNIASRSSDGDLWLVRFTLAHEPESYHLYRPPTGELVELFVTTPALEGLELARMHPVVIPSRDGFDLVSYLSLPPWTDRDADGRPEEPVPLVMLVHGGPSDERAQYAYGPFVHWLANRGYGVFYVNFRGSPGFGKAFMNAQRMEWGGRMHDDLVDQVEWAIAQGITTRDRVGILGGSYGGYAVLVGMTMTPDVFACGIDLVGPSNLEIFMPHWNVDLMSKTIGDPRTDEGLALLRSRSPINFAHQAKGGILIGQGANDSRVPQSQSDTMVERLGAAGARVTYALYPDEGHGFVRPENNASFWAIGEAFLAGCLGGRNQPLTASSLEGSSVEILTGAEHVPGLEAALAARLGSGG